MSTRVPCAFQRRGVVPRVHNKQQAADARDAALESVHVPLRRLAGPFDDMLRVHKHVQPQHSMRCICASLEKLKNGVQRVCKRVAPRVADEPIRWTDVVRRRGIRRQRIHNTAAQPRRSGPQVHFLEL